MLAAFLLLMVGIAHSYLGERFILQRLFRRGDLPKLFGSDWFTRRTLRFAWHLTTVLWWGIAAVLIPISNGSARVALLGLSVTFGVSGLIALVASRARHLSWLLFLTVAAALWLGAPAG